MLSFPSLAARRIVRSKRHRSRLWCTALAIVAVGSIAAPTTAAAAQSAGTRPAAVIDVGCPGFADLQAAVANSAPGDVLSMTCLTPTTIAFSDTITIPHDVTIEASGSSAAVTLDGQKSVQLFQGSPGADLEADSLTMTNGKACGNVPGGAVYIDGGDLTLSNDTITNSASCTPGGAVSVVGGTTSVTDSEFSGNLSPDGAALYVTAGGNLSVSGSSFENNVEGGALSFEGAGQLKVAGSTFADNGNSRGQGGAIDVAGSKGSKILTSIFSGNSTAKKANGGALYVANSGTTDVYGSTFQQNHSGTGGAIYVASGVAFTARLDTFRGNNAGASGSGGAIYAANSGIDTLVNSSFTSNWSGSGGALYVASGTSLNLRRTTFYRNSTSTKGGGGAADFEGVGPTLIRNSTFDENRSQGDIGGAIRTEGGRGLSIRFDTFSGNVAPKKSGSAIGENGSRIMVRGTIFDNYGRARACFINGGQVYDKGFNLVEYADACHLWKSTDVVTSTAGLLPLANNGGPAETMALSPASPALRRVPQAVCTNVDERNLPRIIAGHHFCDIGAFERSNTSG